MLTVYSEKHKLRAPHTELTDGELAPPVETPARAEQILARVQAVRLGDVVAPAEHSLDLCTRIHDAGYVEFLQVVWKDWVAGGHGGEAIPLSWPPRHGVGAGAPLEAPLRSRDIVARIGHYALSGDTSITKGTWEAAKASMDVALTAQLHLARTGNAAGPRGVFALCRPPGHHATRDQYGGYCFLNNAALAAQAFLDQGARRAAILDIDFHHGNGTQSIFYDRSDVLVLSLHGDPLDAFPYYTGFADETGAGAGEGFNGNYPLPSGTAIDRWSQALEDASRRIAKHAPEALVVSLGVDTFKNDPISTFALETEDYPSIGSRIAGLGLPTLFVMEGGYAVEKIGVNTVNVLTGFEGA